jgi:Na+/phosphate symporter
MNVIHGNNSMMITLWIVLILVGLNILMQLLTALRGSANIEDLSVKVTRPVLMEVFPLIILSWLTALDGTHILILIWYYVAAVLIALRALMSLGSALKR